MFKKENLDQRVAIQREVITGDGGGGGAKSWTTLSTVWANVRPMTGRERFHAGQNDESANYEITIRPYDLKAKDRIVWTSVSPQIEMNIRFIKRDPRGTFVKIHVEISPT